MFWDANIMHRLNKAQIPNDTSDTERNITWEGGRKIARQRGYVLTSSETLNNQMWALEGEFLIIRIKVL